MKSNGRWKAIYNTWLGPIGPAPEPPSSQIARNQGAREPAAPARPARCR